MPTNIALKVEKLSKRYRIGELHRRTGSFREKLTTLCRHALPSMRPAPRSMPSSSDGMVWALRDISFEVEQGEIVGVIGRNGAGKTTLLKVLSRITKPTTGRAWINGRVASLLEVGTGFHPELTGRENIFLNGAILGMTRAEIRNKFDEIVSFAEIERFLDTPVKRYSSGMYVRLAFAVAAHLEPDILLVDEVLAVGDARFQQKCLGKMDQVRMSGRTILFVSHNLSAISRLCKKTIVVHGGALICFRETKDAIREYILLLSGTDKMASQDLSGSLAPRVHIHRIQINGKNCFDQIQILPSEPIVVGIKGEAKEEIPACRLSIDILKDGQKILTQYDTAEPQDLPKGAFLSEIKIPEYLLSPGEYGIVFHGISYALRDWFFSPQFSFNILYEWNENYHSIENMGLINLPHSGRREIVN
jgi:lipopolysaccharide transport system ATP-binding protein